MFDLLGNSDGLSLEEHSSRICHQLDQFYTNTAIIADSNKRMNNAQTVTNGRSDNPRKCGRRELVPAATSVEEPCDTFPVILHLKF